MRAIGLNVHILQFQIIMNKSLIMALGLLLATIGLYQHSLSNPAYQQWKKTFGVQFSRYQDLYRSIIFAKNLKIIEEHNSNPSNTYLMAVNQFTALTQQQFSAVMLHEIKRTIANSSLEIDIQKKTVNADIDWTTKGQVSPVKNQGSCGSCWAFSAVAVLQSYALSKGQTVDLSEQQLVDCSHLYGNLGCDGGQNTQALAYVRDHGITDTQSYPYVAKNKLCKVHGGNFKISHIHSVKGCDNLVTAIQERPIGIAVDATNWSKYASGIFDNCAKHLNHNVLLVGISGSFYKIKNSWGTSWGEKGFIRLALGNTCGICQDRSPWVE